MTTSGVPLRTDRIFPLKDAAAYPETDFLDMVFHCPLEEGRDCRIWLMTEAKAPVVQIDDARFEPVKVFAGPPRWLDFGTGHSLFELLSRPGEFYPFTYAQLKVFGLTVSQAKSSHLVITPQTELDLHGAIEDVERMLWGITRADVGTVSISPSTVPVGRATTFLLEYRLGSRALSPGARLRFCVPGIFSRPQVEDRNKPGWIETLQSDAPLVLENIDGSIESHTQVDLIYHLPEGLPAGGRVEILYHTEFTYLFECTPGVMDRRYWYANMSLLAPAVSVDGKKAYVPPLEQAAHKVHYSAGPADRLHLFLPGRRSQNERLELLGLVTDRYRNAPPAGEVAMRWRLVLEGQGEIDLGTPAGHVVVPHRFVLPLPALKPGLYRAKAVDLDTGQAAAVSNPLEVLPAGSEQPNIYWGEIHGHCSMGDGVGPLDEMFRHARDEIMLDFAASADHPSYFTDNQWLWMQDVINGFNDDGAFVTLLGYEPCGPAGHRNIYTSRKRMRLFRGLYRPTRELDVVYTHFAGREDVVVGSHTCHVGDFWKHHAPDVQRFLEIYSMWGAFEDAIYKILNEGAVIGLTGGGDGHDGRCGFSAEDRQRQGRAPLGAYARFLYKCGLTAAVMGSLSRTEVVDALRGRRTYATTGARILLDFNVSGVPMGRQGQAKDGVVVNATVHACNVIQCIEVIRNGTSVHSESGGELDMSLAWRDHEAPIGRNWYCLKVTQRDGERAWSSPVWITTA